MEKISELIHNQGGSYILPFLWMHGESHEVIKEEMDKIEECGIREICLESRPYPGYCSTAWFCDLDFIMEEARKRNMRIWVLDDDKFPTGHANGAFEKKYPELAKLYLAERHTDIIGPVRDGAVLMEPFLGKDGKVVAVLACRKPDTKTLAVSDKDILDLTDRIHNGFVYFDLPEGRYRLFVIYTTRSGGGRDYYVNLIDSKSVRVLIDEVYESHYRHYQDDFGKTFAGFFSDEPELGNTPGYDFHDTLGKQGVKLPWSEELSRELITAWKEEFICHLPALWYEMGEKTAGVRTRYMEAVTGLVKKCFSGQLGGWCEEHGVEYIGHIIEDDNAHARLGCSIGHYYREQKGQHMSGIDVVHFQINPGFYEKIHQWIAGDCDGEFFHYGLAKMGSSCAHIDPLKKGRALCEIFGNYGWAEGVSFMKWLTDHMLVRGINRFVPHAFSPKFPDKDCPPHFYARGNNPQYPYFALLMKYMNRACHLLSGGMHKADCGVLYHAEAEWSGGPTMLFQKPVRKLLEAQLDCDVIPADIFGEDYVKVQDKLLAINGKTYQSLVIPYCKYIPGTAAEFIIKAAGDGLPVYVIDGLPEGDTFQNPLEKEFYRSVTVVELNQLADTIKKNQTAEITCGEDLINLRFLCYEHKDGKVYLFFNENPYQAVNTEILINKGNYCALSEYDGVRNELHTYSMENNKFTLYLEPGQSKILIPERDSDNVTKRPVFLDSFVIKSDWRVSLKEAGSDTFEEKLLLKAGEKLPNMNGPEYFSSFSGTYRYEGCFKLKKQGDYRYMLYLPKVGDCGELFINGREAGMILSGTDRIDITGLLKEGENAITVQVANTLVWKLKDGASAYMQVAATGLLKEPILEIYRR